MVPILQTPVRFDRGWTGQLPGCPRIRAAGARRLVKRALYQTPVLGVLVDSGHGPGRAVDWNAAAPEKRVRDVH